MPSQRRAQAEEDSSKCILGPVLYLPHRRSRLWNTAAKKTFGKCAAKQQAVGSVTTTDQLSRLLIPRAELAASVRLTVGCEPHCGSEIWLCCIGIGTGRLRDWSVDPVGEIIGDRSHPMQNTTPPFPWPRGRCGLHLSDTFLHNNIELNYLRYTSSRPC
jgi:hypothetical protein